jgi:hypothetical protein
VVDIDGPHLLPASQQVRAAVAGKRWDVAGLRLAGGSATLIVIYCPVRDSWVFYLDSDPRTAIIIPRDEVAPLGYQLTRKPEQG